MFNDFYKGKTVLVTGHTGFKGSWLSYWLNLLGSYVIGYSLEPNTSPSHFEILKLKEKIHSIIGDIRDRDKLIDVFRKHKPEIVFHLAAQPLVRESYLKPYETYETNLIGTLNILEACRVTNNVKSVVIIATDKCYKNNEWVYGYREIDQLGGYDPYSSSKACVEILTESYRNSFFNHKDYGKKHSTLIATARAGNVIGGGDWSKDRLVPDIIRSIFDNQVLKIRNPKAVRPWQHVLEPLSGYLMLAMKLFNGNKEFAEAWNFGPKDSDCISVESVLTEFKKHWDKFKYELSINNELHESQFLKLDCSKANYILKWEPVWNFEKCVKRTAEWYKNFYERNIVNTDEDIKQYICDSKR